MKILKPFLYCMIWFILAFVLMYFLNNTKKMDKEMVIDKDVPIVELQVSTNDIYVWEEVEYSIISRVESDNEAFGDNRTFYYDFEWDWVWDLITKKDTVTYTFIETYEDWVEPIVAVEFRWKLWEAVWNKIYVKEWLKPILMYNSIWNTVIFKDMSRWTLIERDICFEEDECELWNSRFKTTDSVTNNIETIDKWTVTPITQNDAFIFNYNNYWEHNISIYEKDKYWNEKKQNYVVNTSQDTNHWKIASWLNIITIPEIYFNEGKPEIFLSSVMKNTLLMYINNENRKTCYVDTNIAIDTDSDWKSENDMDIFCNELAKIHYDSNYENVTWRIYYTSVNNEIESKDFYVYIEQ